MSVSTAAPPYKVTEGLLKTAGRFLHLLDPPCERFVVLDDLRVTVFPGVGSKVDDQIEMVRRAAAFLDVGVLVSRAPGASCPTVTISARGGWSEVHFVVQTTIPATDLPVDGPDLDELLEPDLAERAS